MTKERYNEVFETGQLTEDELSQGWHFCPEYDYLHVGPKCCEWGKDKEKCICGHQLNIKSEDEIHTT